MQSGQLYFIRCSVLFRTFSRVVQQLHFSFSDQHFQQFRKSIFGCRLDIDVGAHARTAGVLAIRASTWLSGLSKKTGARMAQSGSCCSIVGSMLSPWIVHWCVHTQRYLRRQLLRPLRRHRKNQHRQLPNFPTAHHCPMWRQHRLVLALPELLLPPAVPLAPWSLFQFQSQLQLTGMS